MNARDLLEIFAASLFWASLMPIMTSQFPGTLHYYQVVDDNDGSKVGYCVWTLNHDFLRDWPYAVLLKFGKWHPLGQGLFFYQNTIHNNTCQTFSIEIMIFVEQNYMPVFNSGSWESYLGKEIGAGHIVEQNSRTNGKTNTEKKKQLPWKKLQRVLQSTKARSRESSSFDATTSR